MRNSTKLIKCLTHQSSVGSNSYFDITALDKEIVEATTTALASILTNVSVTASGECVIVVEVEASVTPSPQEVVTDETVHPPHDKHPDPLHLDGKDVSKPGSHHHDVEPVHAPVKDDHDVAPVKYDHDVEPKPTQPPVKDGKPTGAHKRHPPRKPTKHMRSKHGKVKHQQSAKHKSHHKRHPKKRVAKKPKKMIKYKKGPQRRPVKRNSMKVVPAKQRRRAALLALARKRAQEMRRRASKGKPRRSPGRGKRTRRIRKRAPRRRRSRGPRKPRHG